MPKRHYRRFKAVEPSESFWISYGKKLQPPTIHYRGRVSVGFCNVSEASEVHFLASLLCLAFNSVEKRDKINTFVS